MDLNLHNFLLSYIYNIFAHTYYYADADNSNTGYLSKFYKYLDVMCKIYDIPPKDEFENVPKSSSYTYTLSDYMDLFKKLASTIISYNEMAKNPLISFYYINMHGGYAFRLEKPEIKIVPKNFVIIFTTPINYYGICITKDHLHGIKEAVKSLKDSKNISCLEKLDKYKYFEVLLPEQKYYDMTLSYDHSKKSDTCMNLYCLNGDKTVITTLCDFPNVSTTLSLLLQREELEEAASKSLVYLFVSSCRSLNYEIIHTKLLGQNAKIPNILDISTQMYIYHNFMYYYNYNMLNCISSDISNSSNSSFENKSRHIFVYGKYLTTSRALKYYLKDDPLKIEIFKKMIKSYISEYYNRDYKKSLPMDLNSLKITIVDEPDKPFNLLAVVNSEVNDFEKIQRICNLYLKSLINNQFKKFELEHFLRMASFGNIENFHLGTSGKDTIEEAIVFAFTDFESPPPEIQSNGLFETLNTDPMYKNLKDIIKSMPLFSNLNRLGSGGESNGQEGGMYRRKIFKRKTYKRHSILQPNRYRNKSSKRRLPQYFK